MLRCSIILAGVLLGAHGMAAPGPAGGSALAALKLIPKAAAAKLARIEGRGANPSVERWYILVQDPKEENGLHEYVVASGEIVASRSLSQFAENLSADDVIGDVVKIDSDKSVKLAQQFGEANGRVVTEMNVELKKDGVGAAPLWTVTCLDGDGNDIGHVVITATKGTVVSHEGFENAPPQLAKVEASPASMPERHTSEARRSEVKHAEPVAVEEIPPAEPHKGGLFHRISRILPWQHSNQPPPLPGPVPTR